MICLVFLGDVLVHFSLWLFFLSFLSLCYVFLLFLGGVCVSLCFFLCCGFVSIFWSGLDFGRFSVMWGNNITLPLFLFCLFWFLVVCVVLVVVVVVGVAADPAKERPINKQKEPFPKILLIFHFSLSFSFLNGSFISLSFLSPSLLCFV